MIRAVFTCMGRLTHLSQAIPEAKKEGLGVVVVDWSCPQRSGSWARASKGVDAIEVKGFPYFHKTRAMNLGCQHAFGWEDTEGVLVLDADTLVKPGLGEWLRSSWDRTRFAFVDPTGGNRDLTGVLLMSRTHWEAIGGGYRTSIEGWGWEDIEMRVRLGVERGFKHQLLPDRLFQSIPHGDDLRERYTRKLLSESSEENRRTVEDYFNDVFRRRHGLGDAMQHPYIRDILGFRPVT